jgi:hypothetical protein
VSAWEKYLHGDMQALVDRASPHLKNNPQNTPSVATKPFANIKTHGMIFASQSLAHSRMLNWSPGTSKHTFFNVTEVPSLKCEKDDEDEMENKKQDVLGLTN